MIIPQATHLDRVLRFERQLVCCRFSPDLSHLFAAGFDGKLHRWSLADSKHESFPAHQGWVESMVLHPSGEWLFTADSWGQVHCWPVSDKQLKPRWSIKDAHAAWLRKLAISPDGKMIATCGNDRMVRVFSSSDGKLIHELKGHEHHVQSVAYHGDGKSLASGDLRGLVKHWQLSDGKPVREFKAEVLYKKYQQYDQGGVRAMVFDPKFTTLYCAGFEGTNANQAHGNPTVVALDWKTGKQQTVMTTKASYRGPILDVVYHPDGWVIGAGSSEAGGVLWFWKPGEAKETHLVKYQNSFRGLGLHPDGKHLAATAFGDRGGQRGGNGRRLTKDGEYPGFEGSIALYNLGDKPKAEPKKKPK